MGNFKPTSAVISFRLVFNPVDWRMLRNIKMRLTHTKYFSKILLLACIHWILSLLSEIRSTKKKLGWKVKRGWLANIIMATFSWRVQPSLLTGSWPRYRRWFRQRRRNLHYRRLLKSSNNKVHLLLGSDLCKTLESI